MRWAAVEPGERSGVGVGGWGLAGGGGGGGGSGGGVKIQKKAIADMKWKTSGLTFALR